MKVWMKIQEIEQGNRKEIVIGICDENLIGTEQGDFKISKHFFKGNLVEIEKGLIELKKATIANIFGDEIVSKALEKGLIEKSGVKKINNIPHAQLITI